MLTQVDLDGCSMTLMEGIIDYQKDDSITVAKQDKYITIKSGQRRFRRTTSRWHLLIKWRDGTESWVTLADMKESNPVETAEFTHARGIDDEPAFTWWVPYTLCKHDVILSAVRARLRKIMHKYGIEIPNDVNHTMELEHGQKVLAGWSKVTDHLVWVVKMDFMQNARWVLDSHKTPDPVRLTYAGVVSTDSVRIVFTYAVLNGLDVFAADICNAYLQALLSQWDYIICGPEFGIETVGKVGLIHRALYGGKSAWRDLQNHLCSCMQHLRFKSCPADPDVWM